MLGAYGVVSRRTTHIVQLGFLVSDCHNTINILDQAIHMRYPANVKTGLIILLILIVIVTSVGGYALIKSRGQIRAAFCPKKEVQLYKQTSDNSQIDMERKD